VALLALATVFAAVLEPYLGWAETLPNGHDLPSAIACVAGVFLIFPVETPRTFLATAGWIAVIAVAVCIGAANCAGVALLHGSANEQNPRLAFAPALAVAAGTSALALALLAIFRGDAFQRPLQWNEFGWALVWPVLIDLPAIFLLFWLMRRMAATQMTLRFVMGPLVAVAIEALALQQHLTAQTWAGLAITSAGSWWMLRSSVPSAGSQDGVLFTNKS
jgi:drug/metabolite transporter (DMT)-like permease